LRVDPQLLAGAQHRTFHQVIGLELLSSVARCLRLTLEGERGGLRPHRQPVDKGQVADDLARQPIGEVIIGWILVQINQG